MTEKIRVDCPECGGVGEVEHNRDGCDEQLVCPTCGGTGQIWALPEEKEFDKYDD